MIFYSAIVALGATVQIIGGHLKYNSLSLSLPLPLQEELNKPTKLARWDLFWRKRAHQFDWPNSNSFNLTAHFDGRESASRNGGRLQKDAREREKKNLGLKWARGAERQKRERASERKKLDQFARNEKIKKINCLTCTLFAPIHSNGTRAPHFWSATRFSSPNSSPPLPLPFVLSHSAPLFRAARQLVGSASVASGAPPLKQSNSFPLLPSFSSFSFSFSPSR